jgi:UDP-N-acetylmuramyl pentapeptide phosphotransferase/UDP-N-acetylglucosamine-1-phosphate transferase
VRRHDHQVAARSSAPPFGTDPPIRPNSIGVRAYVIASGSVILQRLYFKATRGKRLFLMSPLHHHLEMRGWSEVTIVVRMWIIAGMLAVSGVGLFYVEWLTRA